MTFRTLMEKFFNVEKNILTDLIYGQEHYYGRSEIVTSYLKD